MTHSTESASTISTRAPKPKLYIHNRTIRFSEKQLAFIEVQRKPAAFVRGLIDAALARSLIIDEILESGVNNASH